MIEDIHKNFHNLDFISYNSGFAFAWPSDFILSF